MTNENAHLYLPIVRALADGKTIQHKMSKNWTDMDDHVDIGFYDHPENYRIKPEPRKFEMWLTPAGAMYPIAEIVETGVEGWKRITVQEVLK